MINALENVQADNFQNLDSVVNAVETNLGNEDVTTEFFGEEEIDELY